MEYQKYLDERKILVNARASQFDAFDKAILTLASGALGLSLAFIYNFKSVKFIDLVLWTWGFLIVSILSTLASFQTSCCAYDDQITNLDNKYLENKRDCKKGWVTITFWLNIFSAITFFVGIILLTLFVANTVITTPKGGKSMSAPAEDRKDGSIPPIQPTTIHELTEGQLPTQAPVDRLEKGQLPQNLPVPPKPSTTPADLPVSTDTNKSK